MCRKKGKQNAFPSSIVSGCDLEAVYIQFNVFLKEPERQIFYLSSVTMEPHCSIGKVKNLLVHVHNKIHQSNLNSFLEFLLEGADVAEALLPLFLFGFLVDEGTHGGQAGGAVLLDGLEDGATAGEDVVVFAV